MKQWLILPAMTLLLVGCGSTQPPVYRPIQEQPKPEPKPVAVTPEKPTQVHELKEVQDDNFDPDYMYPETPQRKHKEPKPQPTAVSTPVVTSESMGRDECIAMIGQEKFDKYTQMLGSENAAIKRCVLMKSMK
jgi:hypothetical protein